MLGSLLFSGINAAPLVLSLSTAIAANAVAAAAAAAVAAAVAAAAAVDAASVPANTWHSSNAVSMLGHRRRQWASIETALGEGPVLDGAIPTSSITAYLMPLLLLLLSQEAAANILPE